MRTSNGPVFAPESFQSWLCLFKTTYEFALFEAGLGQPRLAALAYGSDLDAKNLFQQVITELSSSEDGTGGTEVLTGVLLVISAWHQTAP